MTKSDRDDVKNETAEEKKIREISEKEAEAGVPDDESIAGEEDPGAAIEEWVRDKKDYDKRHQHDDKK